MMASRTKSRPGQRNSNPDREAGTGGASRRLRPEQARWARHRKIWVRSGLAATAAMVVLLVVFLTGGHGSSSSYTYQVGSPGPGAMAPDFTLRSNMGGSFDLGAQRGKTVLLFFQEGTGCEACWNQLQAIQSNMSALRRAGIDEVVSITTDPLGALRQAASTYGTTIPVLSDPSLAVSSAYHANDYGMMGTSEDGHSFVLVGRSGKILWRADFGGPPNYTMYVPVRNLISDLRADLAHARP